MEEAAAKRVWRSLKVRGRKRFTLEFKRRPVEDYEATCKGCRILQTAHVLYLDVHTQAEKALVKGAFFWNGCLWGSDGGNNHCMPWSRLDR